MIRSLRARHRALVVSVAIVAGGLGVAGLAARRAVPRVDLPAAVEPLLFDVPRVRGSLVSLSDGEFGVTVDLEEPPSEAHLAAYWADGEPGEALPAGSFWLGRIDAGGPRSFRLPLGRGARYGSVVLYDLTRGRIVAAAHLGVTGAQP